MNNRQEAWVAFPAGKNPKLYIDSRDTTAHALQLYHPHSALGHAVVSAFRLLPDVVSRTVLWTSPGQETTSRLNQLAAQVRETLCDPSLAVSFYTGTPGPHRKQTAQASSGNRVCAYIKIADNAKVATLLQNEAETLRALESMNLSSVVPQVRAHEMRGSDQLLYLTPPPQSGSRRALSPDASDAAFLAAISKQHVRTTSPEQALASINQPSQKASADPRAVILLHAAQSVTALLVKSGVRTCLSHGDYAPWNTLKLADGQLYVFDWEYSSQAPALNDLFHCVFMPQRLVRKMPAAQLVRQMLQLPDDPVLGPVIIQIGIQREEMAAYLLLYLLTLATRESAERSSYTEYLQDCLHHALVAAEHPAHRLKILVSAYACEPGGGSEPGVGWNMCKAIGTEHDAWIITRRNNRPAIEQALRETPDPHLHFVYTDLPRWLSFWKKGGRGIRTYYYLWQFAAFFKAISLHRNVRFDIGHHVTFVNDWLFSFLALMPIPYIWGPIGSHPKIPRALAPGPKDLLADRLRYYFQCFMRVVDPLYWLTAVRARLIIGIRPEISNFIPLRFFTSGKYITHTAIGVEQLLPVRKPQGSRAQEFHILTAGRLVPIKGFHLTVRAFAKIVDSVPHARLTIVGKGPQKGELTQLAQELGVEDRVQFIPWLPRAEALARMQKSDVFLFPSAEAGGMVVLEAMAYGVPVACLEYGGPGSMVTPEAGYAVPIAALPTTINSLAEVVITLAKNERMMAEKSAGAANLVHRQYLWTSRHQAAHSWYRSIYGLAPLIMHE